MMAKSLATLIALLLLVSQAAAVSLGKLQPKSHFGEPMQAQIAVELNDLPLSDFEVQLGSAAAHKLLDLPYSGYHQGIKVELIQKQGQAIISLTHPRNLKEPILEFVVLLRWSQGSIQRSYALLPEFLSYQTSKEIEQQALAEQPQTSEQSSAIIGSPVNDAAVAKKPRTQQLAAGPYIVQRGDSLWTLAIRMSSALGSEFERVKLLTKANLSLIRRNDPAGISVGDEIVIPSLDEANKAIEVNFADAAERTGKYLELAEPIQIEAEASKQPAVLAISAAEKEQLLARARGQQLLRFIAIDGEQIDLATGVEIPDQVDRQTVAASRQPSLSSNVGNTASSGVLASRIESLTDQNQAILTQLADLQQQLIDRPANTSAAVLPATQADKSWWWLVWALLAVLFVALMIAAGYWLYQRRSEQQWLAQQSLDEEPAANDSEQFDQEVEDDDLAPYYRETSGVHNFRVVERESTEHEQFDDSDEATAESFGTDLEQQRIDIPQTRVTPEAIETPTAIGPVEVTKSDVVYDISEHPKTVEQDVDGQENEEPDLGDIAGSLGENIWTDGPMDEEVQRVEPEQNEVIELEFEPPELKAPAPLTAAIEHSNEIEFSNGDQASDRQEALLDSIDEDSPLKKMLLAGPNKAKSVAAQPQGHSSNPLEKSLQAAKSGSKEALFYIEINDLGKIETEVGPLEAEQLAQNLGVELTDYLAVGGERIMRLRDSTYIYIAEYNLVGELAELGEAIYQMVASTQFESAGENVDVTVSIGIVPLRGYFDSANEYLLCAKKTVDEAKLISEGEMQLPQVAVFSSEVSEGDSKRDQELAGTIHDLLSHNKFKVEFQPFINLTGRIDLVFRAKLELDQSIDPEHLPAEFLNEAFASSASAELEKFVVSRSLDEVVKYHAQMQEAQILLQISGSSIGDLSFVEWMKNLSGGDDHYVRRITLLFDEHHVAANRVSNWTFAKAMKSSGYKVGLLNFGATAQSLEIAVELGASLVRFDHDRVNLAIKTSQGIGELRELSGACKDRGIETLTHTFNDSAIPDIWQFNIDAIRADYMQVPEGSGSIDVTVA